MNRAMARKLRRRAGLEKDRSHDLMTSVAPVPALVVRGLVLRAKVAPIHRRAVKVASAAQVIAVPMTVARTIGRRRTVDFRAGPFVDPVVLAVPA